MIKIIFLASGIGLFLTLATLFFPQSLHSLEDTRSVGLGWPMAYLQQDQSSYELDLSQSSPVASIWENPTQVNWIGFFFTWVLFSFGSVGLLFLLSFRRGGSF